MTRPLAAPPTARRLHLLWAMLVLATLASAWLGEREAGTLAGPAAALVLALAALKGGFIVLDFMELRHAPALWRGLLLGWLALVLAGVGLLRLWG